MKTDMNLTSEQEQHLARGETVHVMIAGEPCVILTQRKFEDLGRLDYDASPWTVEEMDLLAAEAAGIVAGDGLDFEDDA